ncbi:MAG: DUF362 domain-containing protein [Candidatus Omnitrophota bacterium]
MNSKVSIVKCPCYDSSLVYEKTKEAIDLIGGIAHFIKPGSKVLVKPNILMAIAPEAGIDTHPEVVRAVIKVLKHINCEIFVGDGPSVWGRHIGNIDRVYECSGIKTVCEQEGVNLVQFDKRRMREKFPLTTWLDNCDYFVNVPKFKTHNLTLLTGAIKNLFGLVSGTYKTELHKNYFEINAFSKILVDIYQEAKPTLTIIDGITAMEGEGPGTSGKLRQLNLLLASSDCVALDSILAIIMGIKPVDVLTTKEAYQRGLGTADLNSISVVGEQLKQVIGRPFLLPSASKLKNKFLFPVITLIKRFIRYYPRVKDTDCIKCAACINACPNKIISMKNQRIVFDYSKCIACFCCQEVCPSAAIEVKRSILSKLIGL